MARPAGPGCDRMCDRQARAVIACATGRPGLPVEKLNGEAAPVQLYLMIVTFFGTPKVV